MKNMLIFGGTFDPIHNGHVNILSEIQKKICFDSITIIPCKIPLLKEASHTSPQHRLQMIKLATKYMQNISIDSQEINREMPSYTVDTLRNIRQSFGTETSITFLMGMDAFLTIEQWHHWQDIFKFANILVVNRPQANPNIPSKLEQFIETRKNRTSYSY
jgi:nicotinate-nucleotide adenylyltransferase